jgi:hypothetical protein
MKSLHDFIVNEMASTKFDLHKAFRDYKIFGIITDEPLELANKDKHIPEDSTIIDLFEQREDSTKGGIIDIESILENLIDDPPKGAIIWIVTEKSKNCKFFKDKDLYNFIFKGTYQGKSLDNQQIVISSSEDLLPKEYQVKLNPFVKM